MLTQPFLTDLDSRAAVKGSRDPLGIQPIWTRLGRHVIGNLTTVSTSVRDFTTLLLGYYFAERVAEEGGREGDLATFLKWEQLAAYARAKVNDERSFRGVERVYRNLSEGPRIHLSAAPSEQILGNQKIYGLWGLYTVPARSSCLVEGSPTRLTAAGRKLVEALYLPTFSKAGFRDAQVIVKRLAERQVTLDTGKKDHALLEAVGKVLQRRFLALEAEVFREHLRDGGPVDSTGGLQPLLARVMDSTFEDPEWRLSADRVRRLARLAGQQGETGAMLADRLERIRAAELVLAPAASLFDLLLGRDGQTLAEVARDVRSHWGKSVRTIDAEAFSQLEAELREAAGDSDAAARWVLLGRAMASGDYVEALRHLLAQNRFVMNARANAAPWAELRDGRLQVRFRDEQASPLPEQKELPGYWRHAYFLDALRTVAFALRS